MRLLEKAHKVISVTDPVLGQGVKTDLPAPINVYGVSKLAGEHFAAEIFSQMAAGIGSLLAGTSNSQEGDLKQ